jgi:hypothetical protein
MIMGVMDILFEFYGDIMTVSWLRIDYLSDSVRTAMEWLINLLFHFGNLMQHGSRSSLLSLLSLLGSKHLLLLLMLLLRLLLLMKLYLQMLLLLLPLHLGKQFFPLCKGELLAWSLIMERRSW